MKPNKKSKLYISNIWKTLILIIGFVSIIYSCNNAPTSTQDNLSIIEDIQVDESHLIDATNDLMQLSSNCKEIVVGVLKNKDNIKIADLKRNVCEDDQTKEVNIIYSGGPGSYAVFSASYQQANASFPTATFSTEWTSKTKWYYSISLPNPQTKISNSPNTLTLFTVNDQTKGSDVVELYKIKIKRTENLFPPSVPILSSPSNGASVINWPSSRLSWEESDGNPIPSYDINIYGGSYNHNSSTTNTYYSISSLGLETGKTYSWRVRAKNSQGTSDWSQVRTFQVTPGVTISGPTELSQGVAYFTANPQGGASPYTYKWESRYHNGSSWSSWANAGTNKTISYTWSSDVYWRELRVTVTDSNGSISNTAYHSIQYLH